MLHIKKIKKLVDRHINLCYSKYVVRTTLPKTVGAEWHKGKNAYRGYIDLFMIILPLCAVQRGFLILMFDGGGKSIRRYTIMAKVELKQPIVDEISGYVEKAQAIVLVDYRGLTVEQDTVLRKNLREAGVVYKVYKNTMLKRAFAGTAYEELSKHLDGPTAVAIGIEDATAPARIINNFMKDAPAIEFKGGVVDGTYYDAEGCKVIANIPSRDVLISRLLGSLQSPIANFARVIKQIAEKNETAA